MNRSVLHLLAIASLLIVTRVHAGPRRAPTVVEPGISVSMTEWPSELEPPANTRYLRVVTWRATSWSDAQARFDRRLLTFEVTPAAAPSARRAPRPLTCTHPQFSAALRSNARVQSFAAQEGGSYAEWIDLRDYCSGNALNAMEQGAHVTARFGSSKSRGRTSWVARSAAQNVSVNSVPVAEFALSPLPADTSDGTIIPRLSPSDSVGAPHVFSVGIASRTRGRIYVHNDQFRFNVRGPLGETNCGMPRTQVVPLRDFFETVSPSRAVHRRLDARTLCPDAFPIAGVYEVTPSILLPYVGQHNRNERDVITGDFRGVPVPVRVRSAVKSPYIEHRLEDRPRAQVRS